MSDRGISENCAEEVFLHIVTVPGILKSLVTATANLADVYTTPSVKELGLSLEDGRG